MEAMKDLLPIGYLFEGLKNVDYDTISIIGKTNILALCYHLDKEVESIEQSNFWKQSLEDEQNIGTTNTVLLKEINNNFTAKDEMVKERKRVIEYLQSIAPQVLEKPEILFLRHTEMYPKTTPVMIYLPKWKKDPQYQTLEGWQFGIVTESSDVDHDDIQVFFSKPWHSMGWVLEKHLTSQRLNSPTLMKIGDFKMLQELMKNLQDPFMKIWKSNNRHIEDGHIYAPTDSFEGTKKIIHEFKDEYYTIDEVDDIYRQITKHFSKPDYRIEIFQGMIKQ
jgi:hypothetical protein